MCGKRKEAGGWFEAEEAEWEEEEQQEDEAVTTHSGSYSGSTDIVLHQFTT